MSRRLRPLLVAAITCAVVASCGEQLESGIACPTLCPQQAAGLHDTTFYAIEYDTAIAGYPPTGAETELLLADDPGTLDTRIAVRFDSIPTVFRHIGTVDDSAIVAIDSVFVRMRIAKSDTLGPDVTVEVYDLDIDTTGIGPQDDTTAAVLLPLFNPTRLIGSRTFTALELKDSISVPVDGTIYLGKINGPDPRRLRLGFRLASAQQAQLSIFSGQGGFPPVLFVRAAGDSTIQMSFVFAESTTPTTDRTVAAELADFQLIATAPPPPPANVLRIGGAPARRAYLRFNVPAAILDSSDIVRATLLLTQRPNPGSPAASDTNYVVPFEVQAGTAITDLRKALVFLGFAMDSIKMAPRDSAVRHFEVIEALRRWRGTSAARTPRSLALRASLEGRSAWQADFFGRAAPLSVRPQLRLTFIPQVKQGLP